MRERIGAELLEIEKEFGCQVLYACESGSRAWGFASPDSDFDVRFIYTHPIPWHLRLEPRRDTIERMTPDNLDLAGWELGKALRLFAGCNLALNEWLDSPEIYAAHQDFLQHLRELMMDYFNPKKGLHHYLNMAERTAAQEMQGDRVRIKKAFYVIRPLLACHWIIERLTMPPTLFEDLLQQPLPEPVMEGIQVLRTLKAQAAEADRIELPIAVAAWIQEMLNVVRARAERIPTAPERDWDPLNRFMIQWVPGA